MPHLASVAELAPEGLAHQHRCVVRADALDAGERRDHLGIGVRIDRVLIVLRGVDLLAESDGVALRTGVLQLVEEDPKAADLASKLFLQPRSEGTAITGDKPVELLLRAAGARVEADDPLRQQQAPDAVGMRSAIVNQALPFPNEPAMVLLLDAGDIDGTEHLILDGSITSTRSPAATSRR